MQILSTASLLTRSALGLAGCGCGAYCATTAFWNGSSLAQGVLGLVFGGAFASVAIGSWFLLSTAEHRAKAGEHGVAWYARAAWIMCIIFVLANSIGFAASHRVEVTGGKELAIAAYDRAIRLEAEAQLTLEAYRRNPRWEASRGCTDITVQASQAYCAEVKTAKAALTSAQAEQRAGRPASADAAADTIGWLLSVNPATVARMLPVLWAVVLELAASAFMWLALTGPLPVKSEAITIASEIKRTPRAKSAPGSALQFDARKIPEAANQ